MTALTPCASYTLLYIVTTTIMRRYRLVIAALCTLVMQTVWAGPVQVTDKGITGAMPIVTDAQVATLVYDEADAPAPSAEEISKAAHEQEAADQAATDAAVRG